MGLDSIIPGTEATIGVVSRKIFINGDELNNEILVSHITVNKTFNKIAYSKLVFLDGSAPDREFPLSDDDLFKPGNEIEVQLGYDGETETVFEGIIIKHGIKVKQNGFSFLIIEAKDKAIRLTGSRKSLYHIGKTDKDIITSLSGESVPDIEDTAFTHKQLVQFESSDWDFILTRAEANGMLVLTDDGSLVAKKPATSDPLFTATYGSNIFEFEGEIDARRQLQSVTGRSWDYTKQTTESSEQGESDFSETGNIAADELGSVLGSDVELKHTGHLSQEQLQDWADAYALRNKLSGAVGRIRVQGNADIKPGTTITLEGLSDRFNGDVFVSGVLHQFDGNWFSDVQFGWQDDWFFKKPDVTDKPAGGLLPGVNGLQIGVVLNVSDTEEGGQYRVKVHIPMMSTGNEGIWARVATLDAGAERGVFFRPETGDEVVLGFLNDDPREAIILGYLHSKDKKKSPLPATEGNLEFGFVTKEKLKLVFDDTNKMMTLEVPSGKTIIINDASGAMELKDENKNSIKMDKTGITIEAGGNVVIKGKVVQIN